MRTNDAVSLRQAPTRRPARRFQSGSTPLRRRTDRTRAVARPASSDGFAAARGTREARERLERANCLTDEKRSSHCIDVATMKGQHELDAAILAVFILAELEEMSPQEISEALEIPLSIAYSSMRTRQITERVSYRAHGDRAR